MTSSMSSTLMADDEEINRNIRLSKQLAVAVRTLQWSYAIFWSSSQLQHGDLEWGEGYYNGDIKKRKISSYEVESKYGLQRSKQLRILYLSMLEGNNTTPTTTTHGHEHDDDDGNTSSNVMLSPDDLSDEEWYYVVCMSYVFSPSHCLPGKALATGETIWICNAQHADTNIFTRSLLARSASIQTVVCFPYMDGVIELGVTELITKNQSLIQHVKKNLYGTLGLDRSEINISEGNYKLEEFTENHQIWSKPDEDLQYKKTLSNILSFSASRSKTKDLASSDSGSSFLGWKSSIATSNNSKKQSNVLLKVLHDVPLMHSGDVKRTETNQQVSLDYDDDPSDKIKGNEKFSVHSPMVTEVDKESILNNTIKYLPELEARVEELESRITQRETTIKENILSEVIEETSETKQVIMAKDESELSVKMKESEVLIEVRCLYRDYIVADIMEAVRTLKMDASSIRSHIEDGFLVLVLKAKLSGAAVNSVGVIKRELKRVTCQS